ncbi:putative repeat protein (TIGR01451 family) [Pedobacter sp. W3I1]|uniref:hypothetical protein n=1 Tax=Pedobacter sp. W3I1 TaxID=3042291 RepID=UPI002787B768|nr:hypothetical protein [Pedobacter sp. W3I1]MDQ0639670.1 putative repeat protein (TIGR01451 family) [Pedobacter sp. W3I1]
MIKASLLFLFNGLLGLILLCSANIAFARHEIKTTTNANFNNLSYPFSLKPNTHTAKRLYAISYSKHYIAPAPWQYWSKANEIVITSDIGTVTGTIKKSDGTLLFNFTCVQGTPYVQRFTGLPKDVPAHPLNTVLTGAGLIIEATGSISVNLRNVASDDLGTDGTDANIKGNASLFSFGDAAIGTSFRVGYYRDGNLASNAHPPIYSIMATENNTIIKIAGVATATLNAGQSYLFNAPMGTLVESSGSAVMNTAADLDAPGGCGDGAYNPIPPIASLGQEYVVVRGEGNKIAEQTTVIATEANTVVTVTSFDLNGAQKTTTTFTLAQAGDFKTFEHGFVSGTYSAANPPGINTGRYSSSRIEASKNVEVFSGTAGISGGGGCEADVATLVPISSCSGSRKVETSKFTAYNNTDLSYFGYIITKSSAKILLTTQFGSPPYTNNDIEAIAGIGIRKPMGTSGLYLISFTKADIGSPKAITITSTDRLTVSMVQQGGGFSMSNFISRFPEKGDQPLVSQNNCASATLTANPNASNYQWYLNGNPISGANTNTYVASASGNYSVSYSLDCGLSAPSLPINVSLCNIDRSITKTVDVAYPELNSNVVFTLKAENLGNGNAVGVSVTDLLPAGFTYVSSVAPSGTSYDPISGIWTIGDLASNASISLKITAKVVKTGVNINTATITGSQPDQVSNNDQSSATTTTGSGDRDVCVGTAMNSIIFNIPPGTTNVTVTGLPDGIIGVYDSGTKKLTISGTPTTPGPAKIYTVTGTAGNALTITGTITVNGNVSKPVFNSGLTDKRCTGTGTDTYVAAATNATSIVYSILPLAAGIIDATSGKVTWNNTFTGTATITATAKGCDEKKTDFPVTVSALPDLTLGDDPEICQGFTTSSLTYTNALNNPATYSIILNTPGFNPITNQLLPAGNIPFNVPVDAALGIHSGVLTIKNAAGCTTQINFNIKINPKPSAPHVLIPTTSQY